MEAGPRSSLTFAFLLFPPLAFSHLLSPSLQVHGDVFRPPAPLALFCALVGTGSQLATMSFAMILFATATNLYMGRGAIIVSFLVAYCLTSVVAGYTSGSLYARR